MFLRQFHLFFYQLSFFETRWGTTQMPRMTRCLSNREFWRFTRKKEKGKGCQRAENGIEYNDKALLASYNKKVMFVVCERLDTVC